jgi:hypothetical protein
MAEGQKVTGWMSDSLTEAKCYDKSSLGLWQGELIKEFLPIS